MVSMNDNELLLQDLYLWYKEMSNEKIKWILKKKTPQSLDVKEIEFIGKTLEGLISSIHKTNGVEYTEHLLKMIDEQSK